LVTFNDEAKRSESVKPSNQPKLCQIKVKLTELVATIEGLDKNENVQS